MSFRAIRVTKSDAGLSADLADLGDDDLDTGEVTVRVEFSTINFKDGLAITGASPVIQRFPITPGIDLAGVVEVSTDDRFAVGDAVVLNGWGLSQTHDGGLAQKARVPADWLIGLPAGIDTRQAAAIGTAGYTAMLCILALEHGGVAPEKGEVLVTGASGGVGSVAIALLAKLGYRVIASTGRPEESGYLTDLGASEIIDRSTLSEKRAPIARERWAAVIDSVGSHTLVNALAQTRYGGVVAACGLAQGVDLPGSVLPFILRSVTLAGIDSVNAPRERREQAWRRLATDLDMVKLESMVTTVGLGEAAGVARGILSGAVRGRTLVDVSR